MTEFTIFQDECTTVFGLKGYDENSITYAFGWSLHKSHYFLEKFIKYCLGESIVFDMDKLIIELQKYRVDGGYTDLEIKQPGNFHLIIEAKKNWELPSNTQLSKYACRFSNSEKIQKIITMSAASIEYAVLKQASYIEGFPIQHLSWTKISNLAAVAKNHASSNIEKLWLNEFKNHIKRYISMTNPTNNLAYCVVISTKKINPKNEYTWVDVIETDKSYFHPVGGNWPTLPPNYMAFRRRGVLTSVHHIESYDVVTNLNHENSNWPKTKEDYFVYKLGSPMYPPKIIKNGRLYATGRYWCAIDTLLSGDYETISEARDETQRR